MELIETFFFDTYALYEIIRGNPRYKKFSSGVAMVTTRLNLMELCYGLLLKLNCDKKTVEDYYNEFLDYAIEIDDSTIKKAIYFKYENRKKDLSYVDCIGYVIAIERGIKFLTGDEQFKSFQRVEFVK